YNALESESKVVQFICDEDRKTERFGRGAKISLLFDATPFYAESGGQVGDTGYIEFRDSKLEVLDTQKVQNSYYVHHCHVIEGEIDSAVVGQKAHLRVNSMRRSRIRANHSATHLVHSALRQVLGEHVKQSGSRVDDSTLRFDYSHFEPVTEKQINEIESIVNEEIRSNHEVSTRVLPIKEAQKTGAIALFGEKYGEHVRVVEIGPNSVEFCGGTHVSRSGDIGFCLIAAETGVSAGVRRIECFAGPGAHEEVIREREIRREIAELVKSSEAHVRDKIQKLVARVRELERELEQANSRVASSQNQKLEQFARVSPAGIKVIAERVDNADVKVLRGMVDELRHKLGSGVVALASHQGSSAVLVAGVTPDLAGKVHAGNLIQAAASISGGRGGGRADFAQAGGGDPGKLQDALEHLFRQIS
ncbi:MAG: alanine--tRNA ligase, partial [Bdellovibrionales bacterium]|nr:alanine--tRNA ligase [Bdellovibrionales bacterium]